MNRKSVGYLKILLFLFAAAAVAGCSFRKPVSTSYEIAPHKPEGKSISKTVLLVADNQLNHL